MIRKLWRTRGGTRTDEARGAYTPTQAAPAPEASLEASVARAFWLALWRAPSTREQEESVRALDGGQSYEELLARLRSSTEFRTLVSAVHDEYDTGRSRQHTEAGLVALGEDAAFVDAAFLAVLGREADPSGRAYYVGELADGRARTTMLSTLLRLEEFRAGFEVSGDDVLPRDVQLCELANPAKWHNPEWLSLLTSLQVVPADRASMHRKGYEFTQLLFGLTRLGLLRDDVRVLSVRAGHEPVLYWLANRVGQVVATDMYEGEWGQKGAQEGHEQVLEDPAGSRRSIIGGTA